MSNLLLITLLLVAIGCKDDPIRSATKVPYPENLTTQSDSLIEWQFAKFSASIHKLDTGEISASFSAPAETDSTSLLMGACYPGQLMNILISHPPAPPSAKGAIIITKIDGLKQPENLWGDMNFGGNSVMSPMGAGDDIAALLSGGDWLDIIVVTENGGGGAGFDIRGFSKVLSVMPSTCMGNLAGLFPPPTPPPFY